MLQSFDSLQSKSEAELKTELTKDMTKRDVLIALNDGSEILSSEPVRKYRKDGQIESQTEVITDVETNALILIKTITWTYYPKGEVDEITIIETNSKGAEKRKTIKHFIDGRQPEVK